MAIKRQYNWLGNQRVDVPALRLIESCVANDFQALSGTLMTGTKALVAWGAAILDVGMVGAPAANLILRMASAVFLHGTATEAGAIFTVPTTQPDDVLVGTNPNVVGSFTPGVVNYVSIDLVRTADVTTNDSVVFRDAATNLEFTQTVPLGRVLNYRINISTSNFGLTPTLCPIAKVTVDAGGNVAVVTDCRQMFWRLGTGGSSPSALAQYAWLNRNEATSTSGFTGGDKDIISQSDFNRAIAQRLWELGGGEHWYAPSDDRTVRLVYDPAAVFGLTGENWYWNAGNLTWQGLSFIFGNSTATFNTVADQVIASPGLTDMADGDVIYVELNRTANAVIAATKVQRSALAALVPATPGSRYILAWRYGATVYVGNTSTQVNAPGIPATNTSMGIVQLNHTYVPAPANPVVIVTNAADECVANGVQRFVAGAMNLGTTATTTSVSIGVAAILATILGSLQVNQGVVSSNSVVNGVGVTSSGNGTGSGVSGTGGATAGARGVSGTGGAGGGDGVTGQGTLAYPGVSGTGGATAGAPGITGTGGAGGGDGVQGWGTAGRYGVQGVGDGIGSGVVGLGGATAGAVGVSGTGGAAGGGGVRGQGVLTGAGVNGTGGATAGAVGVSGTGGAAGGGGVQGQGVLTGSGVSGTGGATAGAVGVSGTGGAGGGDGVVGAGSGSSRGVYGIGGAGGGTGVRGEGGGASGVGVFGVGGATNGSGVYGSGGAGTGVGVNGVGGAGGGTGVSASGGGAGGIGVDAVGTASGGAVHATCIGSGTAVLADSVGGTGYGLVAHGNATKAAIHVGPNVAPSTPLEGDIYYDTNTHHFLGWTGASWVQLDN